MAMQPNHLVAERNGFGKQLCVRRYGNAKARLDEIGLEARSESRVRHDCADVGHYILGLDRLAVDFRKVN
jgi:hypothetical protein